MKYAVIKTGGKQYRVSEGDVIEVERLALEPKAQVVFEDVLLYVGDNEEPSFGMPAVAGMKVTGTLVDHKRGEKIRVAKFKSKVRYRRVTGHRQALSQVKIEQIGAAKEAKKVASEKPAVKAAVKKKATAK